jgi:predicted NAD/FAD-binding protein
VKVAIVGSGVSGLVVAHHLHPAHDITVFEADSRIGGHVHTVDAEAGGRSWAVDTGFIVFNEENYPNLVRLLGRLGVASQPSTMSFSVKDERSGLEWNGSSLDRIFAQRSNLLRPSFHGMLADLLRFRSESRELLLAGPDEPTMGEFLAARGYARAFVEDCIVPMGASIWSADPAAIERFPARTFARFFHNHRFLETEQPGWRVVRGGSRTYLEPLVRPFRERIRTATPVERIRRLRDAVEVTPRGGAAERFDEVVIAAHSDQALRMLADPTHVEREVLGAFGWQANDTLLHTDTSVLPSERRARGAWNYLVPAAPDGRPLLTYDMNRLQTLDAPETFCVSLNMAARVDPSRVLRRLAYAHPVFTPEAVRAQRRRAEVSGVNRTHYAGAYWGYGFHEDGVNSALAVVRDLGVAA